MEYRILIIDKVYIIVVLQLSVEIVTFSIGIYNFRIRYYSEISFQIVEFI